MIQSYIDACKVLPPADDPFLEACYVELPIMSAVLRKKSTIIAAVRGSGKSALAYMAQKLLETQCLNIQLSLVDLNKPRENLSLHWEIVIEAIIAGAWARIEADPSLFVKMDSRVRAFKYFVQQNLGEALLTYQLERLAADHPAYAQDIMNFVNTPYIELFKPNVSLDQKLGVLCDAVKKLGTFGVMVWVELADIASQQEIALLHYLFDSVSQMRAQDLYIKCFVNHEVAAKLELTRGVRTLSAERLNLTWTIDELVELSNRRLQIATNNVASKIEDWVEQEKIELFLSKFSQLFNPSEWVCLLHSLLQQEPDHLPVSQTAWVAAQRVFLAERAKIRMDNEGRIWRGAQPVDELTPRKRAIYPLIKYLYEHPGFHKSYHLQATLKMADGTFDTTLSRARDLLEPDLGATEPIYLVTNPRGDGVALLHTDHAP